MNVGRFLLRSCSDGSVITEMRSIHTSPAETQTANKITYYFLSLSKAKKTKVCLEFCALIFIEDYY